MTDLSRDGLNPTDAERAAVMIMLLEDEQAASLLGQLDPAELRLLGERMCALGEISPAAIADAIGRFVEKTERMGLIVPDRVGQVRDMMTRAIGEIKTESLMQRIAPEQRTNSLELARWLTPQVLVPLVRDEHPQAIAVLLVQLDADVAAGVLHGLAEEIQPQVVHRVATLGRVSPDALIMLEDMLARRITECHGQAALTMGGPREAADIINAATRAIERRVMPEISKQDKALAKAIENEMFKFEHLFVLDEKSMGTLLREVDSDTLIGALKGAPEDKREVFFRAMSSRAADGVRDEIAARGRMKMAEVLEAQKAMITAARRLAAEGVIVFGAGDDDYV
ncbi:flagellar motor switch protein FliG [Novosphingobium sp. Fuku2-ISO-50]|uniref:flagellar motor switch protein FliG n=1 Tax=Novosphingobium sp. Fuku2-ISO-50 TaxID=1739114 RepID=UPI00076BEAEA|nr:flagellar motor switch protein FliG [Novosphingobium sp. Fuku2-ISO-50]KUR74399.1 flagellar motor switch protein FliG [Novosphingobium sp. Fuku2-ISO-50]